VKNSSKLEKLVFPIIGILASIWFLIRVIPKPSRATYPCMRVAYPMASAFVVYLLGLATSAFAIEKMKMHWKHSRYWAVAGFFVISIVAGFYTFQADQPPVYANSSYLDVPNAPMGVAKGIFPGRVIWSRNTDATNENCGNSQFGDAYYLPKNANMEIVNGMVRSSIVNLTGKSTIHEAWDTLFVYCNIKKGKGAVGYQTGEKIFIKTNGIGSTVVDSSNHNITDLTSYVEARTSPQPVLAILRELITDCGIPQGNISVGDPQRDSQNEYWNIWHTEYPNVKYICNKGGQGRTKSVKGAAASVFYSDKGAVLRSGSWSDMSSGNPVYNDTLYSVIEQADYLIYVGAFKVHERGGITLIGKCDFGSHTRTNAMHLHMGLVNPDGFSPAGNKNSRFGYNKYRVLVDLMGHKKLGGNAMLFAIDGLWGGAGANLKPVKFKMAPFNNDWPSSIFISQDPVALESVCYDILKAEFTSDKHAETYPQMEGVDDHLHQAADSLNWPAGIRYDPENDGIVISSLGVHEHWDNAIDQKYSRDLGIGAGIELIKIQTFTSVDRSVSSTHPYEYTLKQNYPNPFNPTTQIEYSIPQASYVSLKVYNLRGQAVATLFEGIREAGGYRATFDGSDYASGTYFLRLRAAAMNGGNAHNYVETKKLVLMK
jgi:hypothetical protein